ncbi:MAG TPA: hypothetical protein VJT49_16815 [Amycolatopsis sp.]|uniref:hypothetical protein n=1 Tax=Amycolatopsis sp. TaxID=37632 RepID=UPI002B497BF0|nr:hypothetical protein [Amycolatopsis sp.]HKS46736.1 hypothetical protein [Amycolatopsis sp.]
MSAAIRASLTGDPLTDALIPVAQRFVGAIRDHDAELVDELLAEVILVTGGRCEPGTALAVVLAAMVSDQHAPSVLLTWLRSRAECQRLIDHGVSPEVARQLTNMESRGDAA